MALRSLLRRTWGGIAENCSVLVIANFSLTREHYNSLAKRKRPRINGLAYGAAPRLYEFWTLRPGMSNVHGQVVRVKSVFFQTTGQESEQDLTSRGAV
jgi:hypothetical protein